MLSSKGVFQGLQASRNHCSALSFVLTLSTLWFHCRLARQGISTVRIQISDEESSVSIVLHASLDSFIHLAAVFACLVPSRSAGQSLNALHKFDDILGQYRLEEKAEDGVEHDRNEERNVERARQGDQSQQIKDESRRCEECKEREQQQNRHCCP